MSLKSTPDLNKQTKVTLRLELPAASHDRRPSHPPPMKPSSLRDHGISAASTTQCWTNSSPTSGSRGKQHGVNHPLGLGRFFDIHGGIGRGGRGEPRKEHEGRSPRGSPIGKRQEKAPPEGWILLHGVLDQDSRADSQSSIHFWLGFRARAQGPGGPVSDCAVSLPGCWVNPGGNRIRY